MVLILAHGSRPDLMLIAGILIEDSGLSAAAQRDQAAPVDDHFVGRVVYDFCWFAERDRVRLVPAIEGDDPPSGDRVDEGLPRAAFRRSVTYDRLWT